MTSRSHEEMVARALECEPELLPHLPELLADLDELGTDAELVVEVLGGLGLPDGTRLVDLGCGKGATAVEVADELGWAVHGVDLFAPFIPAAAALAERTGVADLCTFEHGDIIGLAGERGPFDVAVYGALGDVLGPLDETVGILRRWVRPGGHILICDDFVKPGGHNRFPGFEHYSDQATTIARLTAHGDRLVREVLEEGDDNGEDPDTPLIRQRAEALVARQPALRAAVMDFVDDQADEVAFLQANMQAAVWVLERG